MRIIVMTDVHANLPALRAALTAIKRDGYDIIVHTGDAIGIGPYPAECLELLLNTPNVRFVMGNHESYFVSGLPKPQPSYMSDGEVQHQLWTHERLEPGLRTIMAKWPYRLDCDIEGTKVTFLHYALTASGQDFLPVIRRPILNDLERMFSPLNSALVFYGHDHFPFDAQGQTRYVNAGPLGCSREAVATYSLAEFSERRFDIEHRRAAYDSTELFRAFEERNVPERHFIQRVFFGRSV
jgi:predicted phosphodiesterase